MKKDRCINFFSIKGLLLFFIPTVIVIIYILYVKQDIETSNKWFSFSELNQIFSYESFEKNNMYCTSYNNIHNEKLEILFIILFLISFILALIIAFIILCKNKKRTNDNIKTCKSKSIVFNFQENDTESKIQQLLSENLKYEIYNIFCKLQTASMNFDYSTLKRLLAPELYLGYCSSLEILKSKNKQNVFQDFEFIDAEFIDFEKKDGKYLIKVNLKVKFYGYVKDVSKNKIIKGTKEQKIINTYTLNLIKYNNCPNCGAPIEEYSNYCEYCKSDNIKSSDNWLIVNKEKVK